MIKTLSDYQRKGSGIFCAAILKILGPWPSLNDGLFSVSSSLHIFYIPLRFFVHRVLQNIQVFLDCLDLATCVLVMQLRVTTLMRTPVTKVDYK